MAKSKDFFEEKKEKYRGMLRKGKSISYLRSIRETKKDKLERAKNDIKSKRVVYNSLGRDSEKLGSGSTDSESLCLNYVASGSPA